MLGRTRATQVAQLARWLGPWADHRVSPGGVTRSELALSATGGPLRAYLYEPDGVATGVYLVVQGLHYDGPDDPRMDRFCRVLCAAGFVVLAPFLRPYLALVVSPAAAADVAVAWRTAVQLSYDRCLPRPAMFSISFGSTPALAVAASAEHRHEVGGLVLFGGYRDFASTIRFAVGARAFDGARELVLPHDPLNTPAVFINVLPHIDAPEPRVELQRAWLEMARRTWGRPELRPEARRRPIADRLAAELPAPLHRLFYVGCGLAPGGPALLETGLARSEDFFAFADPTPLLSRVAAPVLITHGRDDDVIPFTEARKLAEALDPRRHQVALTGMYGHTGSALPAAASLGRELASLRQLLFALVDAPCERLSSRGP